MKIKEAYLKFKELTKKRILETKYHELAPVFFEEAIDMLKNMKEEIELKKVVGEIKELVKPYDITGIFLSAVHVISDEKELIVMNLPPLSYPGYKLPRGKKLILDKGIIVEHLGEKSRGEIQIV
jgi:hypothetical protein